MDNGKKKKSSENAKTIGLGIRERSEEEKKRKSQHMKNIGHMPPSRKGVILNKEHKRKISEAIKGWKISEETKRKISEANKGKKLSAETKRKIGESHKGHGIGDKNPSWQGGISFEPYTIDWTEILRISIRERDKYICQICGKAQGDITHSIHHIDYDKKNCNPANLITLCNSCHTKTNYKRDNWIEYFKLRGQLCHGQ